MAALVRESLPDDIRAYLDRIAYDGPLDGSAEALAGLQAAHLMTVPYENLDILMKVPLSLEIPDLFDKVVRRHRGGYCFELNGLFAWLLEGLGYPVTQYLSRFLRDVPGVPMRRHRVLKVVADGKNWLCDVGIGGSCPLFPLEIRLGEEQRQGSESYRFVQDPFYGWIVEELRKGEWMRYYAFTEEVQLPIDYVMPSFWCEHAPDSIFANILIVSIRKPDGRITVSGEEFRIFSGDRVEAFTPAGDRERRQALESMFGIRLGG